MPAVVALLFTVALMPAVVALLFTVALMPAVLALFLRSIKFIVLYMLVGILVDLILFMECRLRNFERKNDVEVLPCEGIMHVIHMA